MDYNHNDYINKNLANKYIIPIYHVANLKDNEKFCSNPWLKYSKRDGYWLGAGMYFWSNYGSALFWYHYNKNKYNARNGRMTISKATLNIPDNMLLDLTDPYEINKFNKIFYTLYDYVYGNNHNHINNKLLKRWNKSGGKINWFYYTYQKLLNEVPFKAVKMIGDYSNNNNSAADKVFYNQEKYNGPHITDKTKTIYTAKLPDIIINREIIKVL